MTARSVRLRAAMDDFVFDANDGRETLADLRRLIERDTGFEPILVMMRARGDFLATATPSIRYVLAWLADLIIAASVHRTSH